MTWARLKGCGEPAREKMVDMTPFSRCCTDGSFHHAKFDVKCDKGGRRHSQHGRITANKIVLNKFKFLATHARSQIVMENTRWNEKGKSVPPNTTSSPSFLPNPPQPGLPNMQLFIYFSPSFHQPSAIIIIIIMTMKCSLKKITKRFARAHTQTSQTNAKVTYFPLPETNTPPAPQMPICHKRKGKDTMKKVTKPCSAS